MTVFLTNFRPAQTPKRRVFPLVDAMVTSWQCFETDLWVTGALGDWRMPPVGSAACAPGSTDAQPQCATPDVASAHAHWAVCSDTEFVRRWRLRLRRRNLAAVTWSRETMDWIAKWMMTLLNCLLLGANRFCWMLQFLPWTISLVLVCLFLHFLLRLLRHHPNACVDCLTVHVFHRPAQTIRCVLM